MRNYVCENPLAGIVKAREDALKDGVRCMIISNRKVPFCSPVNLRQLPAGYLGSTLLCHALGLTENADIAVIDDAILFARINKITLIDKRDLIQVIRALRNESEEVQPKAYIRTCNHLMEKIMQSDNHILGGEKDFLSRLIMGVGFWASVNIGHKKLEARQVLFTMIIHAIDQVSGSANYPLRIIVDDTVCDFRTLGNGEGAVSIKLLNTMGKVWNKGVDICLVSDSPHKDMDNIVFNEKPHLQSYRYAALGLMLYGTMGWGVFAGVKALFT